MDEKRPITINISSAAIIKTVVILALFAVLYYMQDLVVLILMALVIASSIEPLIRWFSRYHIARTLSVIFIYLSSIIAIIGVFYLFVPSLLSDLSDFFAKLPNYIDTISVWNPLKSSLFPATSFTQSFSIGDTFQIYDFLQNIGNSLNSSAGILRLVSNIFGGLLGFILIIVLSFYLAVQEDGIAKFLKMVLPARHEEYVIDLWRRSQAKIGKWLQGQVLLGVLIGVLVYLGLTILGVRNALLLALLAALFEIIPVFGPILSAIPSVLIATADKGLASGLLVVGLYVIIHQFENHLIYPLVVKKVVGIPPIIVILALIVGFKLAGILGILLSAPIAAVFIELLEDLQKSKLAKQKSTGT